MAAANKTPRPAVGSPGATKKNWKSLLHDFLQRPVAYDIITRPAPPQAVGSWEVAARVELDVVARGRGASRKLAEQEASRRALTVLGGRGVKSLVSSVGSERGLRNEARVREAFADSEARLPPWLVSVRQGTRAQDHKGVDFVATTRDVGDLYLQIKSSARGKRDFEQARRRGSDIAVIVIDQDDAAEAIRQKVLSALGPLHARYLSLRRGDRT